MQNRELPNAFARLAAAIIEAMSQIACFGIFVPLRIDCAQYAQSSQQPPVWTLSNVLACILFGS
jgi:hypothetical protein